MDRARRAGNRLPLVLVGAGGLILATAAAQDPTRYLSGDPADAVGRPTVAAVTLMGGGREDDVAMRRWLASVGGGDVVVLRASGSDGYQDYLFAELGGVDSVETWVVAEPGDVTEAVCRAVEGAEGIWIAGGDQARYVAWWDTPLGEAVAGAVARGASVGGTSAGCMIWGGWVFAARRGSLRSEEAWSHPERLDLVEGRWAPTWAAETVFDTHVDARRRVGRLAAMVAACGPGVVGVGLDEGTALTVVEGVGVVTGAGAVRVVRWEGGRARVATLWEGERVVVPGWSHGAEWEDYRVVEGRWERLEIEGE